jgi:hypothetical protein
MEDRGSWGRGRRERDGIMFMWRTLPILLQTEAAQFPEKEHIYGNFP